MLYGKTRRYRRFGWVVPASDCWALVYTNPNMENTAKSALDDLGHDTYLPRERYLVGAKIRYRPFFSRYVFLKPVGVSYVDLRNVRGVAEIVYQGEQSISVPESVLNRLKAQADAEGFIDLSPKTEPTVWRRGDCVEFLDDWGHKLFDAIFESMSTTKRSRLFVNLLANGLKFVVPLDRVRRVTQ